MKKDVRVIYLEEENAFHITINKETMLEKETGYLLLEKVYDELGDSDIIVANEINKGSDTCLLNDSNVYMFNSNNVTELKENGKTKITFTAKLKEIIAIDYQTDREFLLWYYNVETIEEAIEILNNN